MNQINQPISGIRMHALNSEQGKLAQASPMAAKNMRARKYSLELLNLAAVRAREIGLQAASEETGVGAESLKKHLFVTKIEKQNQGQVVLMRKANNSKYPLELKREVVRRAHDLQKQTKLPIKRCYDNIGRLLGVNGATIRTSFVRGEFTL
jgi:hypothetical protein